MLVAVILFLIAASSMIILWHERLIKNIFEAALFLAVLILLFDLRLYFLPYATLDYKDFLHKWVDFFRSNGGFSALKYSIGNYNVPYLYFLALFSYIPIDDLYLIKLLSIVFDVVLAYAGMKLVSLFTESRIKKLVSFFLILALPSVVLNGSCWAQCDSIYAAFAILSVYFVLKDRPILSMVMIALSFGFKMQAIFIMPVFAVFLIVKKLKLRHLFVFPLTYVILVLPAVLFGRPFLDTINLYFAQIDTVGEGLNYNSSSVYSFFSSSNSDLAAKAGIAAAFVFIIVLYLILYIYRKKLTNETLFTAALLFSVAVPFFLPHMHDRYFFIADILSLCYAVVYIRQIPLAVLVSFASLLGYYAYLTKRYLLPMSFGAFSLVIVMAVLLLGLFESLKGKTQEPPDLR